MIQKQNNVRYYTWWIFGIVGLIIGLAKADGRSNGHGTMAIIGLVNGIFWGWIIGYIIDKINTSNKLPNDSKENNGLMQKMQTRIFPGGNAQMEKEIKEVRSLLEFKYTLEEIKQTYIHAAAIFFVNGGNDINLTTNSILHHDGSVVTKDDAHKIYYYLKNRFTQTPKKDLSTSVFTSSSDCARLFLLIKGGIVELKREYKDLTDKGKFEVILYNTTLALNIYRAKYPTKYEDTKKELYDLIAKQADTYQMNGDKTRLIPFINSRIAFYLTEIDALANIDDYIPSLVYYTFYVKPLTKPQPAEELFELLSFQPALTTMAEWVVTNTEKI